MQMILTVMFVTEIIMIGVFAFLSWYLREKVLFGLPLLSVSCGFASPGMAMSAWFTYEMIKIYGWPSMGVKAAGETLLAPAFEAYQKQTSSLPEASPQDDSSKESKS